MTLIHSLRRASLRRLIALLAVIGALASAAVVLATAASAGPGAGVRRGAGTSIAHGADWVGQYRAVIGGHVAFLYCINPAKRQPSRLSLATTHHIPGLSATTTAEVAQVLAAHGQTGVPAQAEATSQAVNYLAGNRADVARRARYLSKSTQHLAMSYVAAARRLRGGYNMRIQLSAAALPGQSGRGTVTLTGAGGGRAATVTLSHGGNVSTPGAVRTNSHGVASFTYRTTGTGQVTIAGAAAGLAPATVRASSPAAGYQRMVSASPTERVTASASYQGRVGGFSNSYRCDSECSGHPVVTLRACAPAGAYASRLVYRWPGGSRSVSFAAATATTCGSVAVRLADGLRVTAAWQFRTASGWTAPVAASGPFVVDCPAAPSVAVASSFDCSAASVTAALGRAVNGTMTTLRNPTRHQMVLVVSGAVTGRFVLAPGAVAATHTWSLSCGRHALVTVRSGVQRSGGGWNYGQPATVTLP